VAITTPVDSDVYTSFFLTDSAADRSMLRVGEGAEFPTAILTGGDHTIRLKKYGRRLEASYESIRRLRIDRFALHLGLLAVEAEVDKVTTGIDVLLNGDGNGSTTPTNTNLTTADTGAVAGTLTLKGYLAWLQLWANPYKCDVILARSAYALQVLLLNTGSANLHLMDVAGRFGIGGVTPINGTMGPIQLGWTTDVTDVYLLGIDSRFTLELVQEIGTTLTETNRIVSRQMDEIVMSEVVGFAIMDAVPHHEHRRITEAGYGATGTGETGGMDGRAGRPARDERRPSGRLCGHRHAGCCLHCGVDGGGVGSVVAQDDRVGRDCAEAGR
jgi:hypothetical protein